MFYSILSERILDASIIDFITLKFISSSSDLSQLAFIRLITNRLLLIESYLENREFIETLINNLNRFFAEVQWVSTKNQQVSWSSQRLNSIINQTFRDFVFLQINFRCMINCFSRFIFVLSVKRHKCTKKFFFIYIHSMSSCLIYLFVLYSQNKQWRYKVKWTRSHLNMKEDFRELFQTKIRSEFTSKIPFIRHETSFSSYHTSLIEISVGFSIFNENSIKTDKKNHQIVGLRKQNLIWLILKKPKISTQFKFKSYFGSNTWFTTCLLDWALLFSLFSRTCVHFAHLSRKIIVKKTIYYGKSTKRRGFANVLLKFLSENFSNWIMSVRRRLEILSSHRQRSS